MQEIARIIDQMKRAWNGGAWHGPSLGEVLADVGAEQATARIDPSTHSIWEIVLHLTTWGDVLRRRIDGERVIEVNDAEDWPHVARPGPDEWEEARQALVASRRDLIDAVGRLQDADLERKPPGAESTYYVTLHGGIQHDLYHAGQIALLKRVGVEVP
jgi:uncharacterized damage-inducible protein DinB